MANKFPDAIQDTLDRLKSMAESKPEQFRGQVQVKLGSFANDIFLEFNCAIVRLVMPIDQAEQIGKAILDIASMMRKRPMG